MIIIIIIEGRMKALEYKKNTSVWLCLASNKQEATFRNGHHLSEWWRRSWSHVNWITGKKNENTLLDRLFLILLVFASPWYYFISIQILPSLGSQSQYMCQKNCSGEMHCTLVFSVSSGGITTADKCEWMRSRMGLRRNHAPWSLSDVTALHHRDIKKN